MWKGGWKDEELDRWGNPARPRKLLSPIAKVEDKVVKWRSNNKICDQDFMPKTFVIEEDFEIPQLGKRRKFGHYFHMIMITQTNDTLCCIFKMPKTWQIQMLLLEIGLSINDSA